MSFFKKFFKKSYPTPDMCPICFDNMKNTNTITTKCNHTFCNSCLKIWLKNNNNCPLCRNILNDRSVIQTENISPLPPPQPIKYRVTYTYQPLTFIGTLVSIYDDTRTKCYKFINIEQSSYSIGEIVYVWNNLATIQRI